LAVTNEHHVGVRGAQLSDIAKAGAAVFLPPPAEFQPGPAPSGNKSKKSGTKASLSASAPGIWRGPPIRLARDPSLRLKSGRDDAASWLGARHSGPGLKPGSSFCITRGAEAPLFHGSGLVRPQRNQKLHHRGHGGHRGILWTHGPSTMVGMTHCLQHHFGRRRCQASR
jgi:hypothetical protein